MAQAAPVVKGRARSMEEKDQKGSTG